MSIRQDIKTYILACNGVDDIIRGCAQELRDDGELVDMVLSGEEWLALKHLREDAASAPDINLDIVLLPCEHDLRGAVVSSRDITGHLGILNTCQTEVADLQVAVLVNQNITRFQVAVDDACGVNVFKTPHDLVEEVLDELLLERS